jgi:hypothetical protein
MLSANDAEFKVQMDAEMSAAIADLVKDLPAAPDLEFADVVTEAVDAAPATPEPAKAPEPAIPPPPAVDWEAKFKESEAAWEAKLKDFETKLKVAQDKPKVPEKTPADLAREIEEDPVGFFEKAGISPEQVARLVIAARLGDKAPAEVRDAIQRHRDKSEVAALRREIEAERTARVVEKLKSGAEAAVAKAESPVLAALRAVDPSELTERVFGKVAEDARARNVGPEGPFLSYEDALKAVEADLSKYHRAFSIRHEATSGLVQPPEKQVSTPPPAGTPGRQEVQRPRRAAPPRKPYWEADDVEAERVAALQESLQIARGARA